MLKFQSDLKVVGILDAYGSEAASSQHSLGCPGPP